MNKDQNDRPTNRNGFNETPAEYYNRQFRLSPRPVNQEHLEDWNEGRMAHRMDGIGNHRYDRK